MIHPPDADGYTSRIALIGCISPDDSRPPPLARVSTLPSRRRRMIPGERIVTTELNDKVTVTLDNGNIISGDLLVGADGVHSSVRQCIVNDGAPVHVGVNCVWGRVNWKELSRHQQGQWNDAFMVIGDGQSFVAGQMDEQLIWSTVPRSA
jgi:2-polyprenyl-6-methoxyphenol hydroxylase-like FAD-dependent oxidoreductase